ncbi:MAG: hypothetical protein IKJ91_06680 [Clostridia bacterium]|nr:hypothetical protein [Clostridia bacterium]
MRNRKQKINKKGLILFVALCVLFIGSSSGTISWLSDITDNFIGNIAVSNLTINFASDTSGFYSSSSTEVELHILPGAEININASPIIVAPECEDCYIFIKFDENIGDLPLAPFSDYFSYSVADGWLSYDDGTLPDNVYYRIVKRSPIEQQFIVVEDQKMEISDRITCKMLDALSLDGANLPSLTISAFAVQYTGDGITPLSVSEAWDIVSSNSSNS